MRNFLLFLLAVGGLAVLLMWVRYGGGEHYDDLSTEPLLGEDALEEVLSYAEPIGNVAVGPDGRIFF